MYFSQSPEEIERLTVDENLSEIDRACLLISTGQEVQKVCVVDHLPQLLSTNQMDALCRVVPKLCVSIREINKHKAITHTHTHSHAYAHTHTTHCHAHTHTHTHTQRIVMHTHSHTHTTHCHAHTHTHSHTHTTHCHAHTHTHTHTHPTNCHAHTHTHRTCYQQPVLRSRNRQANHLRL